MVAVVGVTPVGATSSPASAFTNDDLPALNSPITATSSGRSSASAAWPAAAVRLPSGTDLVNKSCVQVSKPAS